MSTATLDQIENALHAWVVKASGYAVDKVLWLNQRMARPPDDYITLKMGDQTTDGAFDALVEQDADLSRSAGTEIELRVEGWREFTLSVQAYTHALTGATCAFEVLTRVQTQLGLPSIREALAVPGIGPSFDRGTVQWVPQLLGTSRFEGRAIMEVAFFREVEASDFVGYINEVQAGGFLSNTVVSISSSTPSVTGSLDIDIVGG